jgi:hypothetical protein
VFAAQPDVGAGSSSGGFWPSRPENNLAVLHEGAAGDVASG